TDVDVESRAREKLDRRVLQGTLRNSKFQLHRQSAIPLSPLCDLRCEFICQLTEKTRSVAGVTHVSVTQTLHLDQHCIVVAVDQTRRNRETISRCLPLHPELAARATEERRIPSPFGLIQCLLVHESNHEHLGRLGVLDHGRNKSIQL